MLSTPACHYTVRNEELLICHSGNPISEFNWCEFFWVWYFRPDRRQAAGSVLSRQESVLYEVVLERECSPMESDVTTRKGTCHDNATRSLRHAKCNSGWRFAVFLSRYSSSHNGFHDVTRKCDNTCNIADNICNIVFTTKMDPCPLGISSQVDYERIHPGIDVCKLHCELAPSHLC